MYLGWNDYELIYLIKEGNELALNLMYHKYTNFIETSSPLEKRLIAGINSNASELERPYRVGSKYHVQFPVQKAISGTPIHSKEHIRIPLHFHPGKG